MQLALIPGAMSPSLDGRVSSETTKYGVAAGRSLKEMQNMDQLAISGQIYSFKACSALGIQFHSRAPDNNFAEKILPNTSCRMVRFALFSFQGTKIKF